MSHERGEITSDEVTTFIGYIYSVTGISLGSNKAYLIEGRLLDLLSTYHCNSYGELFSLARSGRNIALEKEIIDRVATHETLFFRDMEPFKLLQYKILPDLIDARTQMNPSEPIPIKIWSAACSTGQEIYSIAIVIKELLPDIAKYNVKLLATDISDAAIAKASHGTFNRFEVERGLSQEKLNTYFLFRNGQWRIRDDIRGMIQFGKRNLMSPLNDLDKFDIIFCRNVAIYFSREDRRKFYEKLANQLNPDGYLIIGSTESMVGLGAPFVPKQHLQTTYYQMRQQ